MPEGGPPKPEGDLRSNILFPKDRVKKCCITRSSIYGSNESENEKMRRL